MLRKRSRAKELKELRYFAARDHYYAYILAPVWSTLKRSAARFNEERELIFMAIEDDNKHKYDYNYNLQSALCGMDAMMYGFKKILGSFSAQIPRVANGVVTNAVRSSLAFSHASARNIQLKLHPRRRVPAEDLALLTRFLPRDTRDGTEGRFFDVDVNLFVGRFVRDLPTERWRAERAAKLKAEAEAKEARQAVAMAALMALKFAAKDLIAKAAQIQKGPPPPPPGPPPREAVLAAAREALALEKAEEERAIRMAHAAEDAAFDPYSKDNIVPIRRRHSITDPDNMYARVVAMREHIELNCFAKRRNSLPARVEVIRPEEKPILPYASGIQRSLSLYEKRRLLLREFLEPEFAGLWADLKKHILCVRKKRVAGYAWLNPGLPREMHQLLTNGGRRRTIGEPERLAKQLRQLFETRNCLSEMRRKLKKEDKVHLRRRSFDFGEEKDAREGITRTLGYEFEEPYRLPTMADIRRDGVLIDSRMVLAGFDEDENIASALAARKQFNKVEDRGYDDTSSSLTGSKKPHIPSVGRGSGSGNVVKVSPMENMMEWPEANSFASGITDDERWYDGQGGNYPDQWQEHLSEDGQVFYFRPQTGESIWEMPSSANSQILSQYQDEDGNWYWYNNSTGETSWS